MIGKWFFKQFIRVQVYLYQRINVSAQQANPEQKARLWAQLVKQAPMFEGYEQKTTREILMVILQPTSAA